MSPDFDDALNDADQLRHELFSSLTIIRGQTQLLQRQLQRMDGFADGDRARLEAGLAVILASARALGARVAALPAIRKERDGS